MDGRAWWAAVHEVAKSWTQLSDFTFTFHFHVLEKEMATHSSVLAWRIPGTGEPGGLPSMGLHRVRHDWSDLAAAAATATHLKYLLYIYKFWQVFDSGRGVCSFPVGAIIKSHRWVSLNHRDLFFSYFWRLQVWNQSVGGPRSLRISSRISLLASSSILEPQAFLGLWQPASSLGLGLHRVIFLQCTSPLLLIKTSVMLD